jgi:protocatechuate 3,4-dioxygenase alpha subunit
MFTSSYLTASQTVGPFFHDGLLREGAHTPILVSAETIGERLRLEGRVLDGDGKGVEDAMVEIWQANGAGRYNHPLDGRDLPLDPTFSGFGRTATDPAGGFWFETIRPGPVPFAGSVLQAPHICVAIFGRGLLNHLYTRIYFADDPAIERDPILLRVPSDRRHTLLAARRDVAGRTVYQIDLLLQGAAETVFFNFAGDTPPSNP